MACGLIKYSKILGIVLSAFSWISNLILILPTKLKVIRGDESLGWKACEVKGTEHACVQSYGFR